MNRRGFLGVLAGVIAAPAIVKAENLMRIIVPKREIIMLDEFTFSIFPKVNEDGYTVTQSFNKKLKNNAVSGARLRPIHLGPYDPNDPAVSIAKRWFHERPDGMQALPTAQVKKLHEAWLRTL
jgi:hypothetical protein